MERRILLFLVVLFSFSFCSASIIDKGDEDFLSVYPNPAVDYVNIELHVDGNVTPQIQILDLTGKIVLKYDDELVKEHHFFKANIDINDLRSGIYFIKLIQGDKAYSKKLLVK